MRISSHVIAQCRVGGWARDLPIHVSTAAIPAACTATVTATSNAAIASTESMAAFYRESAGIANGATRLRSLESVTEQNEETRESKTRYVLVSRPSFHAPLP